MYLLSGMISLGDHSEVGPLVLAFSYVEVAITLARVIDPEVVAGVVAIH